MVKIEDEKSSHILLGLMNFSEIFGKNVTHDNLKGKKNKLLSSLFLQDTFLENWPPAFLGLYCSIVLTSPVSCSYKNDLLKKQCKLLNTFEHLE